MNYVLVLNQDYTPISTCSVQKAFLLIYLEKAELIAENREKALRTISTTYPFPTVIKINQYVHIPYYSIVLTRQNVFKRDGNTCQYCGTKKNLTLDHLIPKSKGGKSTWTNLVTACTHCNSKKSDQTPEEVGLTLKMKPQKPSYVNFIIKSTPNLRDDWKTYLLRNKKVS